MYALNTVKIVFLMLLIGKNEIFSFNLSPVPNLILKVPNMKTKLPKLRSSYFGYTIVLREKSVIVSAPRGQSPFETQANINETGMIFKCPLDIDDSMDMNVNESCHVFPVDTKGNHYAANYLQYELKEHQWLGAAMDGSPKEQDPLVICAPKFVGGYDTVLGEDDYMHGVCYLVSNTTSEEPSVKKLKHLTVPRKQNYKVENLTFWNYQLGQQGFSAHMTVNNREILMGAPGIDQWKGSVIRYNTANEKSNIPFKFLRSFSYGGYAVSSGYLDSNDRGKIIYVATTPHSTSSAFNMGEAILFDFTLRGDSIEKKAILRGTKYGELFGYAVLILDVNNDDLDDVVVSAPLYSLHETIDVGAVYVFINTGNFFFQPKCISSPFKTEARFGTTLSNLGDINRDGYPDIAIGAPFVDGHGAVAIYLGGPDGLQDTPSQILGMEPTVEAIMFGHSLSKGVDIDDNGFNDLAIGAPESETVFIYRAYPVVDIKASIRPQKRLLELNDTELEVEFCIKMETESQKMEVLELRLEIEVDPKIRRITFRENGDNRFVLYTNVTKANECLSFMGVVKFVPIFVFTPMEFSLTYKLLHDAQKHTQKEFCTKCAVLEPTSRKIALSTAIYRHGCKGDICKVNLKVNTLKMPTNFTFGTSNTLFAVYFIENLGEKAFDARFEIMTSLNVSYSKIPSSCTVDTEHGNKLVCSLSFGLGFTGNSTLEVGFDMSHISQVAEMNITAMALSGGTETDIKDNILNSTISFSTLAALEIIGQSNETFVSILEKSNNFDVFYTFKLQNNGPSTLNNITLWTLTPATHKDQRNSTITFLKPESSYAGVLINNYHFPIVKFNFKNSTSEIDALIKQPIITEELHMEQTLLSKNNTMSLSYNSTNSSSFVMARLSVPQLKAGQYVTIEMVLNIAPKAIKTMLGKHSDYLELFMDMSVKAHCSEHVKLNITKILTPLILVNVASPGTPIWLYIVSVTGGLILVTLMTLGLRKIGFFKRQTKEEMEKIIDEKLEKEHMKAELEKVELKKNDDS